jgi:hypothetical protein
MQLVPTPSVGRIGRNRHSCGAVPCDHVMPSVRGRADVAIAVRPKALLGTRRAS